MTIDVSKFSVTTASNTYVGGHGGGGVVWNNPPVNGANGFQYCLTHYAYNEANKILLDYRKGLTYKVKAAWVIDDGLSEGMEFWRFECVNPYPGEGMGQILNFQLCPQDVTLYRAPGSTLRAPLPWSGSFQANPKPVSPTTQENDMLRKDFTFDYTGAEIAKAIDGKIKDIKAKITAATKHDLDVLVEAGLIDASKKASVEATVLKHEEKIKAWEKEKRPYLKAGVKKFALDSEDVEHFGL